MDRWTDGRTDGWMDGFKDGIALVGSSYHDSYVSFLCINRYRYYSYLRTTPSSFCPPLLSFSTKCLQNLHSISMY